MPYPARENPLSQGLVESGRAALFQGRDNSVGASGSIKTEGTPLAGKPIKSIFRTGSSKGLSRKYIILR